MTAPGSPSPLPAPLPPTWLDRLRERADPWLDRAFDPYAASIRQAPFTIAFAASFVLTLIRAEPALQEWLWWGFAVTVVVQLAAVVLPWRRWPALAQATLPLAQMAALVMLEVGSGTTITYFSALIFLPVVSLALQARLPGVVLAGLGSLAVVNAIAALRGASDFDDRLVRSVVIPLAAVLVALGVYGVTNRLRARTRALQRTRQQQEAALADVRRSRDELAAITRQLQSTSEVISGLVDAARLHAVVATTPEGVVEVFSKGAEALLGLPASEAVGQPVESFYDADEVTAALERAGVADSAQRRRGLLVGGAADGGTAVGEWTWHRRDGEPVPVQVVVTRRPVQADGRTHGYLLVATDITERREAERLQDEFIGLVSHELRTPLTGIMGYLDLLRMGGDLSEQQLGDLDVIDRSSQRLLRLVNDLLMSVQLSAGTFTVLPDQLDLAQVARASVQAIEPVADAANVRLVVRADEAVPLTADAMRLAQVLENLLSNAVKFTPEGGTVTIVVRPGVTPDGGRTGRIEVSDTGIGIGPDELDRLTERFYRGRGARGQRIRGIGLGLPITQAIVDAHHGTMTVRSTLGEGTTFTVEIPDCPLPEADAG